MDCRLRTTDCRLGIKHGLGIKCTTDFTKTFSLKLFSSPQQRREWSNQTFDGLGWLRPISYDYPYVNMDITFVTPFIEYKRLRLQSWTKVLGTVRTQLQFYAFHKFCRKKQCCLFTNPCFLPPPHPIQC